MKYPTPPEVHSNTPIHPGELCLHFHFQKDRLYVRVVHQPMQGSLIREVQRRLLPMAEVYHRFSRCQIQIALFVVAGVAAPPNGARLTVFYCPLDPTHPLVRHHACEANLCRLFRELESGPV